MKRTAPAALLLGPGARGPEPASRSPRGGGNPASLLETSLWEEYFRCYRALREELNGVLRQHGMLLTEFWTLKLLQEGPATLTRVAQSLGLTAGALTTLARGLEARGWVQRTRHPLDRRAFLLSLTPRGSSAARGAREEYRTRLLGLSGRISPEGRKSLARGLSELQAALGTGGDCPAGEPLSRKGPARTGGGSP